MLETQTVSPAATVCDQLPPAPTNRAGVALTNRDLANRLYGFLSQQEWQNIVAVLKRVRRRLNTRESRERHHHTP